MEATELDPEIERELRRIETLPIDERPEALEALCARLSASLEEITSA